MKCEISEICGDWALDIDGFNGGKITIYFNSRQNALNVKRIMEVDGSIPNAATVCDMQEVIRCKDCKYAKKSKVVFSIPDYKCLKTNITCLDADDYCSYGERNDEE